MDVSDVARRYALGLSYGRAARPAKIGGSSGRGNPQDSTTTLGGSLNAKRNGQFVTIEPGMRSARISRSSRCRRISSDFRDGSARVASTVSAGRPIDRGIVHTEESVSAGRPTRVVWPGRRLASEGRRKSVRVMPQLAESVSIACALIGGPVVGGAMYLAQRILKDPLENIVSFEYNISGGWADPQVSKAERGPPPAAESAP